MKQLIIGVALGLVALPALAQEQKSPLDETRNVVQQWVDLRTKISKARNDWRIEQELLQQRISLYRDELASLQADITKYEEAAAQGQSERAKLQGDADVLRRAMAVVEQELGGIERKLKALVPYFPDPLANTVDRLVVNLPADPRTTKLSPSQRLATIVGILNEVDKFNSNATVVTDVREVSGKRVQVKVLYLGLARAYYADTEGQYAGVGVPGPEGWVWTEANDQAPQIALAIGYSDGSVRPAKFVEIPFEVKNFEIIK